MSGRGVSGAGKAWGVGELGHNSTVPRLHGEAPAGTLATSNRGLLEAANPLDAAEKEATPRG